MSNLYIDAMKAKGLADAADLQGRSSTMDGTALYAEEEKIPDFTEAVKVKNMLERKAGQKDGFVCRSSARAGGSAPPGLRQRNLSPGAGGAARSVGICLVHRPGQGAAFPLPLHFPLRQRGLLYRRWQNLAQQD